MRIDLATYQYDVVIVGAGPAGMCAGMYAGRSMLKTVVLERGFPGGELLNTELVEDYPGFETILGHDLAQKFADHAAKFGAEFRNGVVIEGVRKRGDGMFETRAESGDIYVSPTVIVTAGGTPIKLGVPGEVEYAGKGVSYCAICDGAFFKNQVVAVVGGGDTAMEESLFLTHHATKVLVVHRRGELRASKIMAERARKNPKIEFIWHSAVVEILGETGHGAGGVKGMVIEDVRSGERRTVELQGVFVAIGHKPNTDLFKDQLDLYDTGYVKLSGDGSTRTSVEGVFAAGDVADHIYRQAVTAAGTGCMAAIDAERFLSH